MKKKKKAAAAGAGGNVGTWDWTRRRTRAGRGAARVNGGVYRWANAARTGAGRTTARAAGRRAYRQYGAAGHNPTLSGWLGRVVGGASAGVSAAAARLTWNLIKKSYKSLKAAYAVPAPAAATPATATASTQSTGQPTSQQHPVAPPAFSAPTQSPSASAGRPSPTPAGAGAGSSTGGTTTMASSTFPPYNIAIDFWSACARWTPVPGNLDKSIWNMYDALPLLADSVSLVANGVGHIIANSQRDLQGGLDPNMRAALMEVHAPLAAAAVKATELMTVFHRVYAEPLARRNVRGGAAVNV